MPNINYSLSGSWYGTGGGWTSSNELYIGKDTSNYRSCLKFTVPSFKGNSTRLYIKFNLSWNSYWGYGTRAFLTKQNTSSSDSSAIDASQVISVSYVYRDMYKNTRAPNSRNASGDFYFVFNDVKINSGNTYYVYILPYKSDYGENNNNINSVQFDGIWFQFNNSSVSVNIEYTSPPPPPPPPTPSIDKYPYVYKNNKWTKCIPYVYTGGRWVECILYVYTNGSWK